MLLLGSAWGQDDSSNCLGLGNIPRQLQCLNDAIEGLKQENQSLQANLEMLAARPQIHYLSGNVVLPRPEGGGQRPLPERFTEVGRIPVEFETPFASTPDLIWSPIISDIYGSRASTHFNVHVIDLTPKGFTMIIEGAFAQSFSNFTVRWLAVGSR